jgi:hypothetical protein
MAHPAVAVETPICVALTIIARREVSFAQRIWYGRNVGGFWSFDSFGWTSIRDAQGAFDRLPGAVIEVNFDRVFV